MKRTAIIIALWPALALGQGLMPPLEKHVGNPKVQAEIARLCPTTMQPHHYDQCRAYAVGRVAGYTKGWEDGVVEAIRASSSSGSSGTTCSAWEWAPGHTSIRCQ